MLLGFPHHESCDSRTILFKLNFIQHVSVLEETFFQTDDQELTHREVFADHLPDVLRVTQIQSTVNLVKDVEGCRLIFQQRQDQTQSK